MTTLAEARKLVYSHFITEWESKTRYALGNEALTPDPVDESWVRVTILHKTSSQETLGRKTERRFKRKATVFVQVFTPINTGLAESDALCEEIRCIFEGLDLGNVWFLESDVRESGEDGSWFQAIVETDFTYEETK